VNIDGRPDLEGVNRPNAMYRPVTPDAFDALGVEVIQGRGIEPTDLADVPLVSVISETFARRIWGDENPLGRTYSTGFVGQVEVVGVVRDIAVSDLIGEQPMADYYAWDQSMRSSGYGILLVKTGGEPSSLAAPLRSIVHELEPRAAIGRIETMNEALDG